MNRLFRKDQILTIPNLLSMVRILMIPVILWLYRKKQNYIGAAAMIVASGLTDIADGIIARKFHMVSDLGKILDPIADKLTQLSMLSCLTARYEWIIWLLVLFVVKEAAMGISGLLVIRMRDQVNSAQWFGKLSTMVLYTTMFVLFLFPDTPEKTANVLILICAAALLLAMVKYLRFHIGLLLEKEA